mmetsp:Transcript_101259/g.286970  ORF Transcript_101259/g.286970 Transcript_101259/m.286970 type:complete len:217 (-) Transcript_101259:804-1454(-)
MAGSRARDCTGAGLPVVLPLVLPRRSASRFLWALLEPCPAVLTHLLWRDRGAVAAAGDVWSYLAQGRSCHRALALLNDAVLGRAAWQWSTGDPIWNAVPGLDKRGHSEQRDGHRLHVAPASAQSVGDPDARAADVAGVATGKHLNTSGSGEAAISVCVWPGGCLSEPPSASSPHQGRASSPCQPAPTCAGAGREGAEHCQCPCSLRQGNGACCGSG